MSRRGDLGVRPGQRSAPPARGIASGARPRARSGEVALGPLLRGLEAGAWLPGADAPAPCWDGDRQPLAVGLAGDHCHASGRGRAECLVADLLLGHRIAGRDGGSRRRVVHRVPPWDFAPPPAPVSSRTHPPPAPPPPPPPPSRPP